MIEIKAKIHDKFSIEFKVGFVTNLKVKDNNFAINTWFFTPNSLDINPLTYGKTQFYLDLKSNVRLITPIFLLREIAKESATPLRNLEKSLRNAASDPTRASIRDYEYQIKMFTAIFKSAMRDELLHIMQNTIEEDTEYIVNSYIENIEYIILQYRELRKIINVPTISSEVMNYYLFGDEFMSNVTEQHMYRLIHFLEEKKDRTKYDSLISSIVSFIKRETNYKKEKGYMIVRHDDPNMNREFIYRNGVLKKYIESDLFLEANKKKDGVLVEQIYLSIAAGLSMVFATAIAFSVQQKYGNFTMPLFVALVISYMLKDRIKELMRYYFAHKLGSKYFDNKTTISIKDTPIGWIKDGVDFITDEKVPREVLDIRSRSPLLSAENRNKDEKIMLYRKLVFLDRDIMESDNEYAIVGINDIMRLYLTQFVQKMDNPEVSLPILDSNDAVAMINGTKAYYLNIVMQFQYDDQITYKRFRIVFNRSGILELEELK